MIKVIKILAIVILFSSCNHAEEQKLMNENKRLAYKVDSLKFKLDSMTNLSSSLFQKAFEKEDNEQGAIEIYKTLITSDSNSFWANQAKKQLTFLIAKENNENFLNEISGTWIWKETYTNWGEIDSPFKCECKRKLKIIKGAIAEFYQNESLQRRTEIDISTQPDWLGGHLIKLIKFKDKNEIRQILISDNGKEITFTEPNCVCGCETDNYKKRK